MSEFWSLTLNTHSDESVSALTFQMTFHFFLPFSRAVSRSNSTLSSHIFNSLMQEIVVKPVLPTFICGFSSGFWFAIRGFTTRYYATTLFEVQCVTLYLTHLQTSVGSSSLPTPSTKKRNEKWRHHKEKQPTERRPHHQQIGLHRHINYLEHICHVMDLPPACVREITLQVIHWCND